MSTFFLVFGVRARCGIASSSAKRAVKYTYIGRLIYTLSINYPIITRSKENRSSRTNATIGLAQNRKTEHKAETNIGRSNKGDGELN